jgi:hypothetical protein
MHLVQYIDIPFSSSSASDGGFIRAFHLLEIERRTSTMIAQIIEANQGQPLQMAWLGRVVQCLCKNARD